jgi:hypothetical protein
MKWKPVITVDLNIVGFEEGTGKNLGRLGAIVCEGVDNDRRINVNVGSGLTDSDRDSFWADRDQLLGRVVEVKADAVTQNQDGTYSLTVPTIRTLPRCVNRREGMSIAIVIIFAVSMIIAFGLVVYAVIDLTKE